MLHRCIRRPSNVLLYTIVSLVFLSFVFIFNQPLSNDRELLTHRQQLPTVAENSKFIPVKENHKRAKHFVVPYKSLSNHTNLLQYLLRNVTDLRNIETKKGRELLSRIRVRCRDRICSEFLTDTDEPHFKYCFRKTWKLKLSLKHYSEPKESVCAFINGTNRHPVALASYPGSGNTWVRGLIQTVTGLCIGAIYCDTTLRKNGFPGESIRSGAAFLVKSHQTDPRWEGVVYDPNAPFTYFKSLDHIPIYSGAVFILRNPFHAMVAEFKRQMWVLEGSPDNHVGTLGKEYFGTNSTWDKFVRSEIKVWQETVYAWLVNNMNHPVLVVEYEDLKQHTKRELERILDFLQVPYSAQQLEKVVREGYRTYQRSHKEDFQYYTESQQEYVRSILMSTSKLAPEYFGRPGMLDSYLSPSYLS